MVAEHLAGRGITDPRVLAAFARVDRRAFVPDALASEAYADHPLPIGQEQTISQPYIVARTLEALELTGTERVLEVGTGSGYAAALLAELAGEVHTVERLPALARTASERLARGGYTQVHVHVADGSLGWPEAAPYDAIAVAAAGPTVPEPLLDQLAMHGRMVLPVVRADGRGQMLRRVRRSTAGDVETDDLERVVFVPLVRSLDS
jgi:protein-L-isoaspartate(D-aspartate) O-methyltransferase